MTVRERNIYDAGRAGLRSCGTPGPELGQGLEVAVKGGVDLVAALATLADDPRMRGLSEPAHDLVNLAWNAAVGPYGVEDVVQVSQELAETERGSS
jgi:hypothetical protein